MKKWILLVVIICGALAGYAWKCGLLGSGSSQSEMLRYVPADTVYYFGGESAEDVAKFMMDMPLSASTPSQANQMKEMFALFTDGDSPEIKFVSFFISKFSNYSSSNLSAVMELTGMSAVGPFALYSHGVVPVLRVKLVNTEVMDELIEDAVKESGWQYQKEIIDGTLLRLWPLGKPKNEKQIFLGATIVDSIFTLSLVIDGDSEQLKKERFGFVEAKQSLAMTQELDALKTRYGLSNDMLGFLHFERIAQGFLDANKNAFGQDLARYLPNDLPKISAACKVDYNRIVATTPRFVAGYDQLDVIKNRLEMSFKTIFEIKNEKVTNELKKIQGHIPAHALNSENALVNIGFGLNVDNTTPAITALWNDLINTEYSCPEIIAFQEQIKQNNPAMLAMFLGMAQGVQGMGLSVYDFAWNGTDNMPSEVSALFSIATAKPEMLSGMLQMVPVAGGITIANDGSATDIALPMLPPGINVKAAIKGNYLVVFTDEKSAAIAEAMTNESLDENGLSSFGLNYRKLSSVLAKDFNFSGSNCAMQQEMLEVFSQLPMDMTMIMAIDDNGVTLSTKGVIDKPNGEDVNKLSCTQ